MSPARSNIRPALGALSKRLPNLTYEELEEVAQSKGVGDVYSELLSRLTPLFQRHTTRSSIGFSANIDDSRKTIFSLIPQESDSEKGVRFQLYLQRFATVLGLTPEDALRLLPKQREE